MLIFLEVNEALAWHIAAALKAHRDELGRAGLRAPLLADLAGAFGRLAAQGCPGLPDVAEVVAALHDARMEPLLLSVRAAGRVLGLSERTVAKMVRNGELASFKVGNRRLIPRAELERWVTALPGGFADRMEAKGAAR